MLESVGGPGGVQNCKGLLVLVLFVKAVCLLKGQVYHVGQAGLRLHLVERLLELPQLEEVHHLAMEGRLVLDSAFK